MSEGLRRWSRCLDRYETVIKDILHKRSYKLGDLAHRRDRLEREGRARGNNTLVPRVSPARFALVQITCNPRGVKKV
jgi:hypothetical protein